jgi:hypothetical protein
MQPLSSVYKREPGKILTCSRQQAELLLGLLFNLEDGGNVFLRNIGRLSKDCSALYPR